MPSPEEIRTLLEYRAHGSFLPKPAGGVVSTFIYHSNPDSLTIPDDPTPTIVGRPNGSSSFIVEAQPMRIPMRGRASLRLIVTTGEVPSASLVASILGRPGEVTPSLTIFSGYERGKRNPRDPDYTQETYRYARWTQLNGRLHDLNSDHQYLIKILMAHNSLMELTVPRDMTPPPITLPSPFLEAN